MYIDIYRKTHRYAPPAGWVQRDGAESFSAAEDWAVLAAMGLDLPQYFGPSALSPVRGDCLEPLITDRHMLRTRPVAPDEPLIDGHVYVLELGASADGDEAAAYREKWGMLPGEKFVIAKVLRWIGGEWYAQCRDSVASLEGYGAVVARVVEVLPLLAPLEKIIDLDSPQLGANAATDLSSIFVSSITVTDSSTSGPSFDGAAASIVLPALRSGSTAIVTATYTCRSSTAASSHYVYATSNLLGAYTTSEFITVPADTVNRTYALQFQFIYNAGDAPTIYLKSNGSPGGAAVVFSQVRLQVEFIKK
jgi:hypothetical protein